MWVSKKVVGSGLVLLMGSAILAAKPNAASDSDSARPPRRTQARLTKPWSELTDLTEDERARIIEIHRKAVDQIKEIQAKEHQDILAMLTDQQRKEVAQIEEKDREARRGSRRSAATQASERTEAQPSAEAEK